MIRAVSVKHRLVVLDDGQALPITQLWDGDGRETTNPNEALAFTAGTEELGFIAAAIDSFPTLTVH